MGTEIGPRRRALLEAWGNLAAEQPTGPEFDLSDNNRTATTRRLVSDFLEDPSEERFRTLWRVEVLADSVIGGADPVLERHSSIEDVATTLKEIETTTAYDPEWETRFLTKTVVWELFGRLHPTQALILNSTCTKGLADMGFTRPKSYSEAEETWRTFGEVYESTVGHATEGTSHEVPLNHEMSEFLWFIATTDDDTKRSILQDVSERYFPITGWQDETPLEQDIQLTGHMQHIEGYIEAEEEGGFEENGRDDLWNQGYWEDWKDAYLTHLADNVEPKYEYTNLSEDEVEHFLEDLTERTTLSSTIPTYLLGGQSGGILWNEFKSYSKSNSNEAAEVLSYLFDEDVELTLRLDRFASFYRSLDTSGGPKLSLATLLLTFAYPNEYVFYKHGLMKSFFEEFAGYKVHTGYNFSQYWKLNLACKNQLLEELRRGLSEKEPTMLDVYTLLYVWKGNYNE